MKDEINIKRKENICFKTPDLALVTVLSLYCSIESLETTDNHKVIFTFKKNLKLEKLVGLYWSGDLRVEPQQFFSQLKIIKTRIYSQV